MGGRTPSFAMLAACLAATVALAVPARAGTGCGDPTDDGHVNIADVVMALRASAGLETLDWPALNQADVAPCGVHDTWHGQSIVRAWGDSDVGVDDAVLLLRVATGLATLEDCGLSPSVIEVLPTTPCTDRPMPLVVRGRNLLDDAQPPSVWIGETQVPVTDAWSDAWSDDLRVLAPPMSGASARLHVVTAHGLAGSNVALRDDCGDMQPFLYGASPALLALGSTTTESIAGWSVGCSPTVSAIGAGGRTLQAAHVTPTRDGLDADFPSPAPAEATEPYDLVVETGCGRVVLPQALRWSAGEVPDALALAPTDAVPADGGSVVRIRGVGLSRVTSVDFGGFLIGTDAILHVADDEIAVTAPPNPAGPFVTSPSVVTVGNGATWDATPVPFRWAAVVLPTCADVVPAIGFLRLGPASASVSGSSLQRVTAVRIGSRDVQASFDGFQLDFEVPTDLGAGTFTVELLHDGTVEAACSDSWTWRP